MNSILFITNFLSFFLSTEFISFPELIFRLLLKITVELFRIRDITNVFNLSKGQKCSAFSSMGNPVFVQRHFIEPPPQWLPAVLWKAKQSRTVHILMIKINTSQSEQMVTSLRGVIGQTFPHDTCG